MEKREAYKQRTAVALKKNILKRKEFKLKYNTTKKRKKNECAIR